jgi:hypothetical protein
MDWSNWVEGTLLRRTLRFSCELRRLFSTSLLMIYLPPIMCHHRSVLQLCALLKVREHVQPSGNYDPRLSHAAFAVGE